MTKPNRYLSGPYYPNRSNDTHPGPRAPHKYVHQIAYAETLRGDDYDIPTLLFLGAPFELVRDTCDKVFRMMDGKVKDLLIRNEHSCRVKNGKCYWRVELEIIQLDEQFISLDGFKQIILNVMSKLSNIKVYHYRLSTFINL